MIKNNPFNILWFVVVGIVVTNGARLSGAETLENYKLAMHFLSSDKAPSKQETKQFITSLVNLENQSRNSPSHTDLWELDKVANDSRFTTKCEQILNNNEATPKEKEELANTYFEIKFNQKIPSAANLPLSHIIQSNLSPTHSIPFVLHENAPIKWNSFSSYSQASYSIDTIEELGTIIKNHNIQDVVQSQKNLLAKNFSEYLKYLAGFFANDQNVANQKEIGTKINAGKDFIIKLVQITANDEIKKEYNALKAHVGSLPSIEELFPKPVIPQASPAQPIFTSDEMSMLDEAIKNPKTDNESLILKTFKKIIKIIQDPNPNTWELKNEFETISFDFLWKNAQIDKSIIQIFNKTLNQIPYSRITDNDHKKIIEESITKIRSFLNPSPSVSSQPQIPKAALSTVTAAHVLQPAKPLPGLTMKETLDKTADFWNLPRLRSLVQSQPITYQPQLPRTLEGAPQFGYGQHHNPAQQQFSTSPLATAVTDTPPQPTATPEQIEFQQKEAARLRGQKITQLNNYIYDISMMYIENQQDRLQLITNAVNNINNNFGNIVRVTDRFKIGLLSKDLKEKNPSLNLPEINLGPDTIYKAILDDKDIQKLSSIERSKQAQAQNIIDINLFFKSGCPAKKADSLIFLVKNLNNNTDEIFYEYKAKIAKDSTFRTICTAIIEGPDFPDKANFREAYEALQNITKSSLASPTNPQMQQFAQPPVSVIPPTGANQVNPATSPIFAPKPPAQKTIVAVEVPGQTPATPLVQQIGTQNQQPQAAAANPNQGAPAPSGSWLSSIGSGLRAIGSGIAWLFSPITNLISYFFSPRS